MIVREVLRSLIQAVVVLESCDLLGRQLLLDFGEEFRIGLYRVKVYLTRLVQLPVISE